MTDSCPPTVTVGIVCYNQEDYIAQSIESILNQDYRPIQIIVSDDCSTDRTREIIETYRKEYPSIILTQYHEKNLGICKNLISLFPQSEGKYFCWLGGDDYFLPGKLSAQVKHMQANPLAIMSYHDTNVIDETGFLYRYNDPKLGQRAFNGNITRNLITHRCFISALSIMVDMEKAQGIEPTTVALCSDWLYFIEVSMKGQVDYIPDILGVYRRHNQNTTKKIDVSLEENIYKYIHEKHPQYNSAAHKGQAWSYTNYLIKYILVGNYKEAAGVVRKLTKTLVIHPASIPFVIQNILGRFLDRLCLYKVTGTVFR